MDFRCPAADSGRGQFAMAQVIGGYGTTPPPIPSAASSFEEWTTGELAVAGDLRGALAEEIQNPFFGISPL